MPKILFISDHRLNRSPSQRYRYEQYLSFFREQGYDLSFSELINAKDDAVFYGKGRLLQKVWVMVKSIGIRFRDLRRAGHFDIIFIQREALFIGSSFFEKRFFRSGARVIFDFDDSIWLLDTSPENKKWEWLKNPGKTAVNIANAHAVIAGNAYLADYARQFNKAVYIIPTTIDTDFHKPMPELRGQGPVVIGWSGSLSTIKHFEYALPFLKKLKQKYGDAIAIKVIGDGHYKNEELHTISQNWNATDEVRDLNTFDIGIMPLPHDEWAKGKCGLKGLSYMACGVPAVMSPVGVNTEIIQHGQNGFLADNTDEWVAVLSELIENKALRERTGQAGRETILAQYSVEANKQKYLQVLQQATC
ncbi:MAG: glycosyltransferase family 4 protein [Bacteroidetes bacterium]|nr:glycosyltransferase family 4 protein [Bacteroidota bacterium]